MIDDLFDLSFITSLEDTLLDKVPVISTNIANPKSWPTSRTGDHRFFGKAIFSRTGINRIDCLHEQAEKFFDAFEIIEEHVFDVPIYLRRIDVNLQYYGMDGSTHIDAKDNELTVMLMNNSQWKPEWGGQFQMLSSDGNVIEEHEYIPGRVIIFPGDVSHRGLAPIVPYVYRYTTAYRVVMDPDKVLSYVRTYAKD